MSYKSLPAITAEEYIIPNMPLEATCHNNKVMHGGSTVSLLNKKKKKTVNMFKCTSQGVEEFNGGRNVF